MVRADFLGGMIDADVEVIDKAGHGGKEGREDAERHAVERAAYQPVALTSYEAPQVEQQTEHKQADREVDQHRV